MSQSTIKLLAPEGVRACTQYWCFRSTLRWMQAGECLVANNGHRHIAISGWYCPICGGSYGGSNDESQSKAAEAPVYFDPAATQARMDELWKRREEVEVTANFAADARCKAYEALLSAQKAFQDALQAETLLNQTVEELRDQWHAVAQQVFDRVASRVPAATPMAGGAR